MSKQFNLPHGWIEDDLESFAKIDMGQSPDSIYYNTDGLGLPFFQGKTEFGLQYPVIRKWCSEPKKIANEGDILLSIRAPVGPTNIAQTESCIGRGLAAIRAKSDINQFYLFYFFRNIESWLSTQGTGSTFSAISGEFVRAIKVPLAPKNEQTRIVEKLEELLTDLDTGVNELKTAQKKLTQYRQSLLKAAVEGALTAEWRTNNTPSESGSQLLERILKERRARWEHKQLEKFNEQGKTPPKDWQKKYVEPVKPDTTGLMELPDGWVWASVDQLSHFVRNGISKTPNKDGVGYPILKINAVRSMSVSLSEIKHIDLADSEAANYCLEVGDLLATRYNGSVDLLGVFGLVTEVKEAILHPDKLIRMKPVLDSLGSWIEIAANISSSRKYIVSRVKTTAGQTGISGEDLKKMPIPLPSIIEQHNAKYILANILPTISEQSIVIATGLKQSAAQRKNILKAAFSGQLVPQDSNDEPASVLLERIKAERVAQEKPPKKANTRKVKEAST